MQRVNRRCVGLVVSVGALLLVGLLMVLVVRSQDLKQRAELVSVGMPREQVEKILGPPVVDLRRQVGKGATLAWVDQLWQVTVRIGADGRVESIELMPSDSPYRRTMRRLRTLFR